MKKKELKKWTTAVSTLQCSEMVLKKKEHPIIHYILLFTIPYILHDLQHTSYRKALRLLQEHELAWTTSLVFSLTALTRDDLVVNISSRNTPYCMPPSLWANHFLLPGISSSCSLSQHLARVISTKYSWICTSRLKNHSLSPGIIHRFHSWCIFIPVVHLSSLIVCKPPEAWT